MPAARRNVWWLLVFLALPAMVCADAGGKGLELEVHVAGADGEALRTFTSGQSIHLGLELTNHGPEPLSLPFSSAKTFDAVVLSGDGTEVWRFSKGRMYAQMLSQLELASGDSKVFEAACESMESGVPALAPGRYEVVGIIPAIGAELRSAPVAFTVAPAE